MGIIGIGINDVSLIFINREAERHDALGSVAPSVCPSVCGYVCSQEQHCWTPGGGTHPRKVRVGSAEVVKMKLYLYKRARNGGLFYIFAAKKWGLFYTFLTKI